MVLTTPLESALKLMFMSRIVTVLSYSSPVSPVILPHRSAVSPVKALGLRDSRQKGVSG